MADEEAAAGAEPGGDVAPPEGAEAAASPEGPSPPRGEDEEAPPASGEASAGAEEGAAEEAAAEGAAGESPLGEPEGAVVPEAAEEAGGEAAEGEAGEAAEGEAGEAAEGEAEAAAEGVKEEAAAAEEEEKEKEAAEDEEEKEPSPSSLLEAMPPTVSFQENEAWEPPPLQVSVQLSRRISQSLRELEGLGGFEPLEPGSPEQPEEEEESEEAAEARRAEERRQRAELVEQYRQLVVERGRLRNYSAKLQGVLAEALNKAKGGKERGPAELEQHISDKEQRYSRYLAMLQELRSQQEEEMAWYRRQTEALQQTCQEKLAKVNGQWKAFQAAKKEVAVYTMGQRLGGKHAAIQRVDQIQSREESKEKEMTEVHLEYIKLKHRIAKLEASLKAQEELAEGLHLIDFEQLKIENQTYNEKIEERNEELLKLRRKTTNTVQVLTHVKEKLQFLEAENQGRKFQLTAVEVLVAKKRDRLTKAKQERDRLRIENEKFLQKCGLLGDKVSLRDFEETMNAAEVMTEELETLKFEHAGLSLTCEGVKKKIRGIKSFLPI